MLNEAQKEKIARALREIADALTMKDEPSRARRRPVREAYVPAGEVSELDAARADQALRRLGLLAKGPKR